MDSELKSRLEERKKHYLYRSRLELDSAQGPAVQVSGSDYLNFCSNDYLSLANNPEVIASFKKAADQYGVGGGASHLVVGHGTQHHALEEELADFTGRERALLFSTGYMANIGAVNALIGKGDGVFEDKLNHASLLDAGLLSGARFQRYLHCDAESLDKKLQVEAKHKMVVTDGVFSMDGDLAPLRDIVPVCEQHNAWLMVDDAHGFGVLGEHGGGIVEHFHLKQQQVPVLIGTLGKAFGTAGAFVAGSEELIENLIQFARTYIYTTSLPPAVAAATRTSLHIIRKSKDKRDYLQQLIRQFREGASQLGYELMESDTPIQPILIGDSGAAMQLSARLKEQGILVSAIRPPTVPAGTARLRVTLCAGHTEEQVNRLLDALDAARAESAGDAQ